MSKQLHKRFSDQQIKSLLERYLGQEIKIDYILEILAIRPSRFYELVKEYRKDPEGFSIFYKRKERTRSIAKEVEKNIIKELKLEKKLIENKEIELKSYNYSYIKDRIFKKYKQEVSLPTIIDRAKREGFYLRKAKKKNHDHEVLTNYVGELIQHDSSVHKWSPYAEEKWYLITTLDDHSRFILYADFVEKETSWDHILALEAVFLKYGFPFRYYVDSHSIFRFVQSRDSLWRKHHKLTDQADPQWKQVLNDCNVKVTYALSPQAKGKIERPYGWLQDRIFRTCAREGVKKIEQAREVLSDEINRYNYHKTHSVIAEIPALRLQRALDENHSLFRDFSVPLPFQSSKDLFCLRDSRIVNPYRKISFNNLELKVSGVPIRKNVQLRIIPDFNSGLAEIRFWYLDNLVGSQIIKIDNLNLFQG